MGLARSSMPSSKKPGKTVSKNLGVYEVLELLDKLKRTVRSFAAREDQIKADFETQSSSEKKGYEFAAGTNSPSACPTVSPIRMSIFSPGRTNTRLNSIDFEFESIRPTSRVCVGSWRGSSCGRGRLKYETQKRMLEVDRRRDAGLATATATFKKLQDDLDKNREAFAPIETAAQKAFRGYGKFRRLLSSATAWPEPDLSADENCLLEELAKLQDKTRGNLEKFHSMLLPRLFGRISIWLLAILLVLGHAALPPLMRQFGSIALALRDVEISLAATMAFLCILHFWGSRQAGPGALIIAADLAKARRMRDACLDKGQTRLQKEQDRIKREFESARDELDLQWQKTLREAAEMRVAGPKRIDDKALRASETLLRLHRHKIEKLEQRRLETVAGLRQEAADLQRDRDAARETAIQQLSAKRQASLQALDQEWKLAVDPVWDAIRKVGATAEGLFPEWRNSDWEQWSPPMEFKNVLKFARLEVDFEKFVERKWENRLLKLPWPPVFSVPLLLTYPCQGSILFETTETVNDEVVESVNNIIYRLLSTTPPGKLTFTIIDPIGLGQSFAGLMHLSDFSQSCINGRIWTQTQQIEEKLAELNEHMEKVIQMYLRNEYATIAEYNAQAGVIAEKYHILVIAGFPVNFSEAAARCLLNIAASGPRCGVYMLVHWDHRHAAPHDFVPDELRKNNVRIIGAESGFAVADWDVPGARLVLEAAPSPEVAMRLLRKVGGSIGDANRVEVPFSQVAPSDAEMWTGDTTEELRVPIGRSGATKMQYLAIGKGTCQHALIAGKTGSGKSTLFHVIIANLALWCDPDQVEFYLVDFKKGVEFKCYAIRQLPHARVVAIESDREFGVSVLQRVDDELRRRGALFRKLGVQDIAGYKNAGGTEPMPRCLLIIDEFQEFFVEDDKLSQNAAVLLDRIVRQGRAFGIHALLGSQTLGGAYTLARATIGQMTIRIALQCNEADAYMIMDESNAAPRLLSRPGEGIYNDTAGTVQGNSPFQAVWLSDEERDAALVKVRHRANRNPRACAGSIVFEGNTPADVRDNAVLREVLGSGCLASAVSTRIWLGAPNSVKGPTEAVFHRQSGNNLLVVGQREESALAILSIAMVSIASQHPKGTARFVLFDSSPPGSPHREFMDRIVSILPFQIERPKQSDLAVMLSSLAEEIKLKTGEEETPGDKTTFLIFHGLENFKKLRQEDDFNFSMETGETGPNPAALLVNIVNDGPGHGVHVVATCDTYNNAMRFLGRKAIAEISMRVLFQMSANDSANLIDSPDAGSLGLHRALFYNDQEGYRETFRPYALPGIDWFEEVGGKMSINRSSGGSQ